MLEFIPIYIFCTFAMLFASFVVLLKSAFATSLVVTLFSISSAILYFFLNSPDVSMTEVSVSVFLTTAFYLMTARIVRIEFFEKPTILKMALTLILFLFLLFLSYNVATSLGEFGLVGSAIEGSSKIHLISSYKDYQIPNVVTTILASFRGFDTMGETVIIFTSAIGVFLILQNKNSKYTTL